MFNIAERCKTGRREMRASRQVKKKRVEEKTSRRETSVVRKVDER
jgi:hypothetical protein